MTTHRIGVVGLDPYLRIRVQRSLPDAQIVGISEADELSRAVALPVDLLLVDVDSPLLSRVVVEADGIPMIGVGQQGEVWGTRGRPGRVLTKPVSDAEIPQAVADALGLRRTRRSMRESPLAALVRGLPAARVAAMVLALVSVLAAPTRSEPALALAGVAVAYAALRAFLFGGSPAALRLDVIVSAALLAVTGGPESPYVAFAVVAVVAISIILGGVDALLSAVLVSIAGPGVLTSVLGGASHGDGRVVWAFLGQIGAVAVGGTLLGRTWARDDDLSSIDALVETRKALENVHAAARHRSGALTSTAVAGRLLDEAMARWRAPAGVILLDDGGILREAASVGLNEHTPLMLETSDGLSAHRMPSRRHRLRPDRFAVVVEDLSNRDWTWSSTPLREGALVEGVMMLASAKDPTRRRWPSMRRFGRRAALALRNARLLTEIRGLALDEERQQLAEALEREVAEALVHLRFELEFLTTITDDGTPTSSEELQRLSVVAQHALANVRTTIADLEGAVAAQGLAASLRDYCRTVGGVFAPELRVHARTGVRLPAHVEAAAFRIACDALHAALRHGDLTAVDVAVEETDAGVVIEIADDGRPAAPDDRRAETRRLMVRQLHERARRAGLDLEVRCSSGGNATRLRCPVAIDAATEGAAP